MAVDYTTIVDEQVEAERVEPHRLNVTCTLNDEFGIIDLYIRFIQSNDIPLTLVHVRATVRNPVEIFAVVIGAATTYAACVAGRTIASSGKIIYKQYDESKNKFPKKAGVIERSRDLYKRIKKQGAEFKGEAINSLAKCAFLDGD